MEKQNSFTPDFFSTKSISTLAGAAGTTWLLANLLRTYVSIEPKWSSLIIAMLLAISFFFSQKEKFNFGWAIKIFLNGLLITANAISVNTINNAFDGSKSGETKASLIPFIDDYPWFPPKNLLEENKTLLEEKKSLQSQQESLKNENKKLKNELAYIPKNENEYKNRVDSLITMILNCDTENKKLKTDLGNLSKDKENVAEIYKLRNQLQDAQKTLRERQKELNECRVALKTNNQPEIDRLTKRIKFLEDDLRDCKNKNPYYKK